MFLPLTADSAGLSLRAPRPGANLVLIGLTVVVSLLGMLAVLEPGSALVLQRGSGFNLLQLLTHPFLHVGVGHLIGNMICVYAFGNVLNKRLGHARYVALYLSLGVAAGLAWLACGGGGAAVGASGVAMGLAGLFFCLCPRMPMMVLVSTRAWFVAFVVILFFLVTAAFTHGTPGRLTLALIGAGAGALHLVWTLIDLGRSGASPREGYLVRLFLGCRLLPFSGAVLVPLLVGQDVVALMLTSAGVPSGVAHSAHVGGALAGVVCGLVLTGQGWVRGTRAMPTLLEWIGVRAPLCASLPRVEPHVARRPESTLFHRRTTKRELTFSDWQRKRLQGATR